MKNGPAHPATRFILIAIYGLLTTILGPLHATQGQAPLEENPAPNKTLSRMVLPGTQDLQLIVQLSAPSVVERMIAGEGPAPLQRRGIASGQSRLDLQSTQARGYRGELASAQQQFIQTLAGLRQYQVDASLSTVMNAVILRVPVDQYRRVRSLPGVKKVYFSRPQRMLLDAAAVIQNAQGLWDKAGGGAQAGRGIKIGIIDTGIDITNPMFIDSTLVPPAGFPKGEGTFTNSKVIVARNYISLLFSSQRVQTAVDEVGHGTFVAGVAAGKQVTAPLATISGMAPGAFLGSYKIFGTPGVNDSTTTAAVVAAVDAALADGMDVINLSEGGLDYLPPADDPTIAAIENAVSAGVVVTISAGNDGPMTHTISNPGGAPSAITVGSVTNSRIFTNQLRVTAPAPVPSNLSALAYLPGDGPAINATISSTPIVDVQTLDGNGYGCFALPSGSLSRKIAFVERGSATGAACYFVDKVNNASAAGASAVIVYNNIPNQGPIPMGGLTSTSIPAVMISNADGLALKAFITANQGSAQIEIDSSQIVSATPVVPRVLSDFSSTGPAPNFSIKPDLVAVGENVYSAAQSVSPSGELYSATKFTLSQGTSFSSPMVAGTAAGLKQLFPGLGPLAIKSLISSTASRNLTVDGTNPPNIMQAGSGLLDMGSAAAAGAVFSPTNLNFGVQSYAGSLSLTSSLSIKNISSITDQYVLSIEPLVPGPTLTLSQGTTAAVPSSGTASIDISLQIAAPLSGGFQGFIVIRSSATPSVYRIPYWAGLYVPNSSRILSVSRSATGSNTFTSLTDALNAARPGNIVEIADSGTYAGGFTISTNAEGLPLHGVIIRAATGQTPTIDGTGLTDQANIMVIGLQNVLFQGLKIANGNTGIWFYQPSAETPVSATIDHCTITNTTSGSQPTGIYIDGGGTIDVTQSTITNSAGAGITANDGTYLTVLSSTLQNNLSDGIDATNSNVQVLNSTVSGNTGPGLNLVGCYGTIDGSNFAANRGSYGDGVEIVDGTFAVTNNTFDSNDRAGIGFFSDTSSGPGPIVNLTGNTLHANVNYGVYSGPGQSLSLDGNLIKDNGRGLRLTGSTTALLTNNIVVRSTSSSTGDGVEVTGSSNVRMVNNTIYQNALQGIVLSTGATASVVNTIVSSNRGGDIQGLSTGSIQSSLIGDQTLSGNVTGDPKFVNAASDVFDLSPGSPAMDAGSNSAASLPFLDYYRRLRVAPSVTGTAPAGSGTVDIGATEANSSYPLIYPLLANGNQPALGDNFTTGIAVLNYGGSSTNASFSAYDASGGLLAAGSNPATRTIGPEAQIPILGFQLFGFDYASQSLGSVLASSPQPMAGFFLIFDSLFKRLADGVNVSDQTGTDLIYMRHESDPAGTATYVLSNPGVNAANITANLLSSSGAQLDTPKSASVAPKGQFVFRFNAATSSSGYVRVQSDRPVSGLEIFGDTNEISALGAGSPGSEARLFFPHVALNQGFTTSIGIINSNLTSTSVSLTAYDNNGQVLGTPTTISLGPNAQLLQAASDLFDIGPGSLVTGYVIAECDQAGVQGFTAFRYDDGTHKSAAAVPVDSVPRKHLLFSHIAHQVAAGSGVNYQTGIALLNPFGTPVGYTIRVFDGSGNVVAEKSDTLGPRQKVAKILSHPAAGAGFFTQPLPLASGHIEVLTDYALLGFELFFTEDYSQLASVPAQIGK